MPADVRIVVGGPARIPKSVQVDGHELGHACHRATVDYSVAAIPQVTLVLHGREVEIVNDDDSGSPKAAG